MDFFQKNALGLHVPTPEALSATALEDVYLAVKDAVEVKQARVNAICVLFDRWTNRYKARPFLGVRVSSLEDWTFRIVTLGCHVLPAHTSREVVDHFGKLLKMFFTDSMMVHPIWSKLLKVETFQHCSAHALHFLVTANSINKLEHVAEVIQKCRSIVTALYFKSLMINNELALSGDKMMIDNVQARIAHANEMLVTDDQFWPTLLDNEEKSSAQSHAHTHQSLKATCFT